MLKYILHVQLYVVYRISVSFHIERKIKNRKFVHTWLGGILFKEVDMWEELSNVDSWGLSVMSVISNSCWNSTKTIHV